ncbi:MAG: hypothetical protein LBV42_00475 [Methanobrevibacter sp.]|nr:hypothetical protein [Methanobrevibacter sp.]
MNIKDIKLTKDDIFHKKEKITKNSLKEKDSTISTKYLKNLIILILIQWIFNENDFEDIKLINSDKENNMDLNDESLLKNNCFDKKGKSY